MKALFVAAVTAFALTVSAGDTVTSPKAVKSESGSIPKVKATCCCKQKATTRPAKADTVRKVAVTGSKIPVKVDKQGRPIDSTLTVSVVDEESIRLFGLGSPGSTLNRMPMITVTGHR